MVFNRAVNLYKNVQFKAKCTHLPQLKITASDQTFSDQPYHLSPDFGKHFQITHESSVFFACI